MSLHISVTYDDSTYYTPGYSIVVSGLNSVSGAATVLVQREDLATGDLADIRGIANTPVIIDTAVSTDLEHPYYNDVAGWQYNCYVYDDDGVLLASTSSGTFTGEQSRNDLMAEFPYTTVVIASIMQPAISLPVIINDFPTWTIAGSVLGTFKPLGRKFPVVITDAFGAKSGQFNILSDIALSGVSDKRLIDLLTYNDTFLFQPYFDSGNVGNMYIKITDISANRITLAESVPSYMRTGSTCMQYVVSFVEVDRPITSSAPTTIVSWQDVLDNNATWQDVFDAHPDWLDVLNNPTG